MKSRLLALILSLSIASFASNALASPAKYYIDPSQIKASAQIQIKDKGTVTAQFRNATGAFSYDADAKTISNLRLAIDATSLAVSNKTYAFEVQTMFAPRENPEITFTATGPATFKDGKADVAGTLNLHGKRKDAVMQVMMDGAAGQTITLSISSTLKRADFGMGEDETISDTRFEDTLAMQIEMLAMRQ